MGSTQVTAPKSLTRKPVQAWSLIAVTVISVLVCAIAALPFLPALIWALALGIAAHPVHYYLARHIKNSNVAAGLAVAVIAILVVLPVATVSRQLAIQTGEELSRIQVTISPSHLRELLAGSPPFQRVLSVVEQYVDLEHETELLANGIRGNMGGWVRGTAWTLTQMLVTLFLLFYLFRDRQAALSWVEEYAPLSHAETEQVLETVGGMIHATVYGTMGVACIQGLLGGLMFWILGLPAPLVWGAVMTILSMIPMFGASIIWIPFAVGLALQGSLVKAIVLLIWGSVVVATIDNVLYPLFVGKRMKLHTVPVFIVITGGLFAFGVSGLILGPAFLALSIALLNILRRRMENGRSAQDPVYRKDLAKD